MGSYLAIVTNPDGTYVAGSTLAPLPADWATSGLSYHLVLIPHPDDPSIAVCAWVPGEAGGDPVSGTGWGFNWGGNWGGGS